jgi:hypothetical protein
METQGMKKFLYAAVAALALTSAGTANAAVDVNPDGVPLPVVGKCGAVQFTGITELACAGGYDKNLLNGSPLTGTGLDALHALGYVGDGSFFEPKLDNLNSGNTIDFTTLLTGITYIGLHQGTDPANMTSFFKLDAGTGVDKIGFLNDGLSNAVLFSTGGTPGGGGVPPGVPEPSTWLLMLLGFGAVGAVMRRRQSETTAPRLSPA